MCNSGMFLRLIFSCLKMIFLPYMVESISKRFLPPNVVQLCPTLCDPMDCNMPGFPVIRYLPEFSQIHVYSFDDAIQPSHSHHPLLLLPSIFPSIRVFSNESALCMRWPKYWSFSFNISPSNEGLDWQQLSKSVWQGKLLEGYGRTGC